MRKLEDIPDGELCYLWGITFGKMADVYLREIMRRVFSGDSTEGSSLPNGVRSGEKKK